MPGITHAAVVAIMLLVASAVAARQSAAPTLTPTQRLALQAVIAAVNQSGPARDAPAIEWPVHILRASDGSHYVAFSVVNPPGMRATEPVTLYVRLATRPATNLTVSERSAVAEWLEGRRGVPVPPQRGMAFGEMPTYGAGSAASRGQPSPHQSLAIMEMQRERARERQEERDRERKAALEGQAAPAANPLLPFEDFDLGAVATADATGALALQRSFTAGPGDYDLTIGWTVPAATGPPAAVHVFKRSLRLPVAPTDAFALSSVIVADEVTVRDAAFPANQQTAHPYSIGGTEILPARDHVLTGDEKLTLVFQVINPRAAPDGKPDVAVGFRLYRLSAAGEASVGVLNPQIYNQVTLPHDFDVARGHPLFAAVQVPLTKFTRGEYRMQIRAEDRLRGVSTTGDATFRVIGTPAALLGDAPPLGQPFRREALLTPALLEAIVSNLRPATLSPALAAFLDAARQRQFVDLMREEVRAPEEQGVRAALRALAVYGLGDTATAVWASVRQAQQAGAPAAVVQMLTGSARALEGNDRDAIAAWEDAITGGMDASATAPLLIDAYLRQGDAHRASEIATAALVSRPGDAGLTRRLAAACISTRRMSDAVALLEEMLGQQNNDLEAQWLRLHALFAGFAGSDGPGLEAAGRDRFRRLAAEYVAANGRHAALAAEWADVLPRD